MSQIATRTPVAAGDHPPTSPSPNAALLCRLIAERGLTCARLARASGLLSTTVVDLRSGRRPFYRRHAEALAPALGVDPAAFTQQDERGSLDDRQRALVALAWPRARRTAGAFSAKYGRLARMVDWEGEAAIGLCHAAQSWRPDGGATFTHYATGRVAGACLDALRRSNPRGYRRNSVRPDPYAGKPETVPLTFDVTQGDPPVGSDVELADSVERLLGLVPPARGRMLRIIYLDANGNLAEVARRLGYCASRISQLHAEAISSLRQAAIRGGLTASQG